MREGITIDNCSSIIDNLCCRDIVKQETIQKIFSLINEENYEVEEELILDFCEDKTNIEELTNLKIIYRLMKK